MLGSRWSWPGSVTRVLSAGGRPAAGDKFDDEQQDDRANERDNDLLPQLDRAVRAAVFDRMEDEAADHGPDQADE